MDMSKVIEAAKKALDVESDYALAKKLEIPNNYIADYRSGKRRPDAYACARMAEVLEMDPFELLAQVEAETEKNEGRRAYWKKIAEKMAATSLAVFLVFAALPETSKAAENSLNIRSLLFSEVKSEGNSRPFCLGCSRSPIRSDTVRPVPRQTKTAQRLAFASLVVCIGPPA